MTARTEASKSLRSSARRRSSAGRASTARHATTRWGIAVALGTTMAAICAYAQAATLCSKEWCRSVEEKVHAGDAGGHGPDLCSDEWKSTVEFKLGIRGAADLPPRGSEAWCRRIDELVRAKAAKGATAPAFSCEGVAAGSVAAMICGDADLAALDRKLAEVYAAASKKATDEHPPVLKAEQRGWIKGRDECWKSDDERACVQHEYERRIAELQARYRLVAGQGPIRFTCDGDARNEVVVTFFETEPPTLIAERGDGVSLMFVQPGGDGARYQGRNESFREHQGEASVTWGPGAPEMHCKRAAQSR